MLKVSISFIPTEDMLGRNFQKIKFRVLDALASMSSPTVIRSNGAGTPQPRIFFVVHNRNHQTIFSDVIQALQAKGIQTAFATIGGHRHEPQAAAALTSAGQTYVDISAVLRTATPSDIVCVGNDWGPKRLRKILSALKARGVKVVGIVEGARFKLPNLYRRVDELLCWGPSGLTIGAQCPKVVGSPTIEKAGRRGRTTSTGIRVLVNYKFSGTQRDVGFKWGAAAIAAARLIDPDYILSTHPSSRDVPPEVRVSHESFTRLLSQSTVVITRSSTVIYEALVAGVSVIYAPLPDEDRAEFGDPAGAFETAETADELLEAARRYAASPVFKEGPARTFLDRHVSIDPTRSAVERIADALTNGLPANRDTEAPTVP